MGLLVIHAYPLRHCLLPGLPVSPAERCQAQNRSRVLLVRTVCGISTYYTVTVYILQLAWHCEVPPCRVLLKASGSVLFNHAFILSVIFRCLPDQGLTMGFGVLRFLRIKTCCII